MIDSIFLWLFIKISTRWFGTVVFATDPETDRTTSVFFFNNEGHANRLMEIIEKEKLNHELQKGKSDDN